MLSSGTRIYSVKEIFKMCEDGFSENLIAYYERAPQHIKQLLYCRASNVVRRQINLREGIDLSVQEDATDVISVQVECTNADIKECTDKFSQVVLSAEKQENEECVLAISQFLSVMKQIVKVKANAEELQPEKEVVGKSKMSTVKAFFGPANKDTNISRKESVNKSNEVEEIKTAYQGEVSNKTEEKSVISPYAGLEFGWKVEVEELWLNVTDNTICSTHNRPYKQIQVITRFAKSKKYSVVLEGCAECKKLYITKSKLQEYESIFNKKGICYHIEKGEDIYEK